MHAARWPRHPDAFDLYGLRVEPGDDGGDIKREANTVFFIDRYDPGSERVADDLLVAPWQGGIIAPDILCHRARIVSPRRVNLDIRRLVTLVLVLVAGVVDSYEGWYNCPNDERSGPGGVDAET